MDGRDNDSSDAIDDFNGARVIGGSADGWIGDEDGHGTLLAGIIFSIPGNMTGIASPISSLWNIKLMPVKFLDADSPPTAASAKRGIEYAVKNGAHIINASWHVGPGERGLTPVRRAIEAAHDRQVLVVAAAGNDGSNNDLYPTYPANLCRQFNNVLSVLATDRRDHKASFSNYGKETVHLGAPGVRIMTTGWYRSNRPVYRQISGTSAAAAFATCAAALVQAHHRLYEPSDVIAHLIATGDDVPELARCTISGKRLNLANALNTAPA